MTDITDGVVGVLSTFRVDASKAGEGQLEISINDGDVPNQVNAQKANSFYFYATLMSMYTKWANLTAWDVPKSSKVQKANFFYFYKSLMIMCMKWAELWVILKSGNVQKLACFTFTFRYIKLINLTLRDKKCFQSGFPLSYMIIK